MSCGDYSEYWQFLINGQFFDALHCPHNDLYGGMVLAMLVFGAVGMSLYVYTGSIVLPLVLGIILASVVIIQLPSAAAQLAAIVVVLGITIAGYVITMQLQGRR